MRTALAIRTRVFVDEQGVPPDEEIDAHDLTDEAAVHALLRDARGAAIGAGRYYVLDAGAVQVGRMAIDAGARGLGAGAALLAALVASARQRGFAIVRLHAQMHARGFYVRAGFCDDGPAMWDAGILHQPMRKTLA
ncbi:MAG: GNAT family N-acetyltransferase [Candidatus Eremiobacteraeota bacterium]|nr:GNAT family N-acetyltransferase [Candidatus Eremiobacteraeota bacterium]